MPLSHSAISEIKAELSALHDLKGKIDARVHALEAILEPLDFGQAALPFLRQSKPVDSTLSIAVADDASVTDDAQRSPYASTGLRAAILDVLRSKGPQSAPQASDELAARGFSNDSTTPLKTRVYNDLWRMSRNGGPVKNSNGVFSVR